MDVKPVPTMGWTNRSVAATILLVNQEQRQAMAARIASLMDAGGLTNETLAYKSGVSVKTVSRLLHARHEPHIGTIEKIAAALKVDETTIRGDPPSPLGLGRSAGEAQITGQLDRIETQLQTIDRQIRELRLVLTQGQQDSTDQVAHVERELDRLTTRLDAEALSQSSPTPAARASSRAGRRRKPA